MCGRYADTLIAPGGRLHCLRERAGGGAVSLDRILVFGDPGVGSDAVCVCDRAVEPLSGLAGRAHQAPSAERIGEAAECQAAGKNAIGSIAAWRAKPTGSARTRFTRGSTDWHW